jgi:Fe-S-cluster-containing hydrogenase components 1
MIYAWVVRFVRLPVQFGTVNYNADSGKVIKCDLCGGDPECAKACPTDAITYQDANWTGYDRMKDYAAKAMPAK